jgi:hypothetical protein
VIIVRVARGITEHFPARASEWGFAALLIWLGFIFAGSPQLFAGSQSYGGLARLADEGVWAAASISIGVVRLVALIVNGTFADSWYGRWSPHVRGICAFLSCGIWFPICAGFLLVEGAPIIKAYTSVVFAIDAYNIRRVWKDAGRTVKAYADAASS